uniref:Immunoglobulin heavy variable 9-4 n=1 Tax=Scleropages formosus TaxID=113540 RepID=A0A8C9WG83_SCLFO
MRWRFNVYFLSAGVTGVQSQVVLTQPGSEMGSPGGSLTLKCACSGFSVGGTDMYWIRQAPGKGLEWIIFYYYSDSYKSTAQSVKGRFRASKDSSNLYLHMTQLKTEDTAVYYCARDTVSGDTAGLYNNCSSTSHTEGHSSVSLSLVEQGHNVSSTSNWRKTYLIENILQNLFHKSPVL